MAIKKVVKKTTPKKKTPAFKPQGVIKIEVRPEDFRVGGESTIKHETRVVDGDWTPYFSTGEDQRNYGVFDSNSCTNFSALNVVEAQVNYLVRHRLSTAQVDWLKAEGFLDAKGEANLDDRFLACVSGTTVDGNLLQTVCDALRKHGAIPQQPWTVKSFNSIDEWFDKSWITPELYAKGQKFLEMFDLSYEWVLLGQPLVEREAIAQHQLKHAPLYIAVPVGAGWNGVDVPSNTDERLAHAVAMRNQLPVSYGIADHYVPYNKNLMKAYNIPYAIKIVVNTKNVQPVVTPKYYVFKTDLAFGYRPSVEVKELQKALQALDYMKQGLFGWYANATRLAVYNFQLDNGITGNFGYNFGPATRKAMNLAMSKHTGVAQPALIRSSIDPTSVSLTIKAGIPFMAAMLSLMFGLPETDVTFALNTILAAGLAIITAYGAIRKFWSLG